MPVSTETNICRLGKRKNVVFRSTSTAERGSDSKCPYKTKASPEFIRNSLVFGGVLRNSFNVFHGTDAFIKLILQQYLDFLFQDWNVIDDYGPKYVGLQ